LGRPQARPCRPYLEANEREGNFRVVAIVSAQEFQRVFSAKERSPKPGVVSYGFYILDAEFWPGFIKICTYFPTWPRSG
jgi:hypothetical protein